MIRVIGLGSPWGDDQAGWLAARALRGLFDEQLVEVSVLDRPGPALLEHWRKEDSVLLLDAVRGGRSRHPVPGRMPQCRGRRDAQERPSRDTGTSVCGAGEPGSLYCLEGDEIARLADAALSSHNLGVAECVALARSLDDMPERLCLLGLEIGPIRRDDAPSSETQWFLAQWTDAARVKVEAWLRDESPLTKDIFSAQARNIWSG